MSWLLLGGAALIASLCLFLIFGYYNYFRDLRYSQSELDTKMQTIARRLSAELLIAPRGAPDAVTLQVAKELGLRDVIYGSKDAIQNPSRPKKYLYSVKAVPFLEDKYVIRGAVLTPRPFEYFNFSILFSGFLLISFIVGFGMLLQTSYLRRHVIRPIESLVETSTGDKNASERWPTELRDISQKLTESFQDRERVVFSQIARGVVHDIKTILQSFKVASDLAKESPTEARVKNLVNVSQNKLPLLLELIDTTLDGSREISISPRPESLNQTVNRSIENIRALCEPSKVEINVDSSHGDLIVCHDPIQLERVFTNLLKNGLEAIEETAAGTGELKISFNLANKDFVIVLVEDSGVGLPKQAESIFRLLKSTKPKGSGLGLLVSRKIVEAHHGRITAGKSEDLLGARFEVLLPNGALL